MLELLCIVPIGILFTYWFIRSVFGVRELYISNKYKHLKVSDKNNSSTEYAELYAVWENIRKDAK